MFHGNSIALACCVMSQSSLLDFYSKTSDPLPPPSSSRSRVYGASPPKKRRVGQLRKSEAAKKPPSTGAAEKEKEGNGTEEMQTAKEDGKSQSGKVMVSWLYYIILLFDIFHFQQNL